MCRPEAVHSGDCNHFSLTGTEIVGMVGGGDRIGNVESDCAGLLLCSEGDVGSWKDLK